MKLNDVANLSLGILKSRHASPIETNYKYKIIESPDIGDIYINKKIDDLQEIFLDSKINDEAILKKRDILMKVFPPYSVSYIEEEYVGCIVASNIAIIRSVKINANYLYLYLRNNKLALDSLIEGTAIKILNLSSLRSLDIDDNISNEDIKFRCNITKLLDRQEILLTKKIKLINIQKKYYFQGEKNGK